MFVIGAGWLSVRAIRPLSTDGCRLGAFAGHGLVEGAAGLPINGELVAAFRRTMTRRSAASQLQINLLIPSERQ